jgi:outer membrane protein TolC
MKRIQCAAAASLLAVLCTCVHAQQPERVTVRIAGKEVEGLRLRRGESVQAAAPLDFLGSVGGEAKLTRGGAEATVLLGGKAQPTPLQVVMHAGRPWIWVEDAAQLLNAVTVRTTLPAAVPGASTETVHILAKVTEVRVENGMVRISTSFPVPFRSGTLNLPPPPRGYVDCLGAVLVPDVKLPDIVKIGGQQLKVRAEMAGFETVRILLEVTEQNTTAESILSRLPAGTPAADPPGVLSLPALLRQVEAFHPKLQGSDLERRVAGAKRTEKLGAFDPVLNLGADYLQFPDDAKRGNLKSANTADAAIEFVTPYGTKVAAGGRLNLGKVKAPLSPTGELGEFFVSLKVPLNRNAGINPKSVALRQAELGIPLAQAEFIGNRLELLAKAAAGYWDWVAAVRRQRVARDLLQTAQQREQALRERAEKGDIPPIDAVEAATETARRTEAMAKADRDVQKEALKLGLYLWSADGTPVGLPTVSQAPLESPAPVPVSEEWRGAARAAALDRRPELKAIATAREIVKLDVELAKNDRRPEVELAISPGYDAGFLGAGPTLKAGINIGLPLMWRGPDGRIDQGRFKIDKLDLQEKLERQRIVTEVEDAVSAVNAAYTRYLAAQRELELARTLEQGERDRFAFGDSTLFLLNQRERATFEAAVKVINIHAEYEQAVAQLRAVSGQL